MDVEHPFWEQDSDTGAQAMAAAAGEASLMREAADAAEPSLEEAEEQAVPSRPILAGLLAMAALGLGLAGWVKLKLWAMQFWTEFSLSFMPVVLGVAAGLAVRGCTRFGSRGLATFVSAATLLASLAGVAIQHRLEIGHRLHRFAALAYDETFTYAQRTANLTDDARLRWAFTNSEVAVIGRLAHSAHAPTHEDYWQTRNFYYLHWIACRQMAISGQGGVDQTLWEATRVADKVPFIDRMVTTMAAEPVTDYELAQFKTWEQPYLQRVASKAIARQQFEDGIIAMANQTLDWNLLLFHGLGPLIGLCTVFGAMTAYKLVHREREVELV